MGISPLELNGTIARTQDYSVIRQNEEQKSLLDQGHFQNQLDKELNEKPHQVNAQNNAETSVTRVNSISHVTNETAAYLAKNILAHADGLIAEIPTISIKPTIHEGETLCLRKKKK